MAIRRSFRSLAVPCSIFLQPSTVKAIDIADMFDGYSNASSSGSWESPITGANYVYGGSYTFKFKRSKNYTPLFQGEMPSYKIGCNGMSLKGGFLALLGLDDIQVQLQDAGAAFAWGIMMGLEYTLPSIASVFKTLQQWARTLQSLMQNACNIGKALAKYAADSLKDSAPVQEAAKIAEETSLGTGFKEAKEQLDSFAKKAEKVRESIAKFTDNPEETLASGQKKKEAAPGLIASVIKKSLEDHISITTSYLSSLSNPNSGWGGLERTNLSTILSGAQIGDSGMSANVPSDKKAHILLLLAFFGDIGLNNSVFAELDKFYNTDGKINAEAVIAATLKSTNGQGIRIGEGLIYLPPVIGDSKKAARALIFGFSDTPDVCSGSPINTCNIPDYRIAIYGYPREIPSGAADTTGSGIATASNTSVNEKKIVLGDTTTSSQVIPLSWDGFYKESLKGVLQLIDRKKGVASNASINAPLLLPNIDKYAGIIKNLEVKAKGPNGYTQSLKEMLARANAFFAAIALANEAEQAAYGLLKSNKINYTAEGYKDLTHMISLVSKRKADIVAAIKEEQKNEVDFEKIQNLFKGIENEQTMDSTKIIGGR